MNINKCFNLDKEYNKILFQSKNFKVIPSLGSIVEGWLLIIPKEHYISFGEVTKDSVLLEELNALLNRVCKCIENEYGDYIIFEHGPIKEKSTVGCGVDYAHIHIVPINLTMDQISEFSDQNFKWKKVEGIRSTNSFFNAQQAYLYFQDNYRNSYIGTNATIPSQFFRQIIANRFNKPEMFDWKSYYFLDNISKTYNRLEKYNKVNNLSKVVTYA